MPEGPRCNLFHDFINKLRKGKKSRGGTALVNTSFLLEGVAERRTGAKEGVNESKTFRMKIEN